MTGFDDRDGLIWFDGEWVDWRKPSARKPMPSEP
jgi:hypothetical protein